MKEFLKKSLFIFYTNHSDWKQRTQFMVLPTKILKLEILNFFLAFYEQ